MEISFMDSIRDKRIALPLGMKYFVNGAEIGKYDKSESNVETSNGVNNAWDGLITSIDAVETWAANNNYTFSWKGFVWWQGESHGNRTTAEHQSRLEDLISNVRSYVDDIIFLLLLFKWIPELVLLIQVEPIQSVLLKYRK